MLHSDWYELQPRLKAGDRSPEVAGEACRFTSPKPKLGKRFSWYDESESDNHPNRPADLMSIDYEVQDGVSETAVLEVWPKDTLADTDRRLLSTLADTLDAALEDAIDAEVEDNARNSISDTDVPSVAAHRQNSASGPGVLPIVRVIAEIWSRLAAKTPAGALAFVQRWSTSFLKMDQRLALYAAADTAVPASEAADVLVALPQSLLFFTDTTVEVFRLMHARWKDFPRKKRAEIERRIIEGPPRGRFKTDDVEIRVDRSRYDVFGEMQRAGLELT